MRAIDATPVDGPVPGGEPFLRNCAPIHQASADDCKTAGQPAFSRRTAVGRIMPATPWQQAVPPFQLTDIAFFSMTPALDADLSVTANPWNG
jgi:hypothetical protein